MTRVLGSMVMRNEEDRYLASCLSWSTQFLDKVFVYDDQSTDASPQIARDLGCIVDVRPDDVPSFLEDEGRFRLAAWKAFELQAKPRPGDWVFSFDADEFLVAEGGERAALDTAVRGAKNSRSVGVILPFPEVFMYADGSLWHRTDGFWGGIKGPRLFEYRTGGEWKMKKMGCGSEPTYVGRGPFLSRHAISVLHLGYAKDEDKTSKYERYSSLENHGHNNDHVNSIVKRPTLKRWTGKTPDLMEIFGE
jgi:glycosyltransferase involved in cell wall biosynthesis